jgi:hypothetical protein
LTRDAVFPDSVPRVPGQNARGRWAPVGRETHVGKDGRGTMASAQTAAPQRAVQTAKQPQAAFASEGVASAQLTAAQAQMIALQRTVGNQAVLQLLSVQRVNPLGVIEGGLQAKEGVEEIVKISQVRDRVEALIAQKPHAAVEKAAEMMEKSTSYLKAGAKTAGGAAKAGASTVPVVGFFSDFFGKAVEHVGSAIGDALSASEDDVKAALKTAASSSAPKWQKDALREIADLLSPKCGALLG